MTGLPDGWRMLSLNEVAHGGLFNDGDWVETKDQDPQGSVRLTQLADVGVGEFRDRSSRWLREDQAADLHCTFLQPSDVLIARMPEPIGRACLAPEGIGRAITAVDVAILRVNDPEVDPRYVMWAVNNPKFHAAVETLQSGTTRKRISRKNLATLAIPIPDLHEQRRIVDILEDHLSRLDATDVSFVSVRAKMTALRDAIIHSALFADQAGEAEQRSQATVGEVADVDSGPAFKSSLFGGPGEGTRLLRGDNIEPGSLRWGRTKSWPDSQVVGFEHLLVADGDIILAMDRPVVTAGLKLARVTAADMPALLVQRVARIRPRNTVVDDFLYQILSSRQFVHELLGNQVGTQIPHITLEAIRKFPFLLPEPAVQIAIAKQVRAQIESTGRVERDITLASTRSRSLRRALLGAAFSGRLTGRAADMEMVEEMAGV
jgi:type I restriction enzyme S subunit